MFKAIKYAYQNIEQGDNPINPAAGGGEPDNSTPPAASIDNSNGQNVAQETEQSILAEAKTNESSTNESQEVAIPEKYQVKKEDGSIDNEASMKKLVDGYNNLSKRFGEGKGLVPETAEGYKIEFDAKELNLPEGTTAEILTKDEGFQAFAKAAHELGASNELMNLVANEYVKVVDSIINRKEEDDKKASQESLMSNDGWKTTDEYNKNINNALKAFNHFASEQDKALIDTIGNNPVAIRLLASIGAQMREDSPVINSQSTESKETISDLMKSEAYQNSNHADHNRVRGIVKKYFSDTVGNDPID